MGNAFIAGLKNEAPRGRDITNEDRSSEVSQRGTQRDAEGSEFSYRNTTGMGHNCLYVRFFLMDLDSDLDLQSVDLDLDLDLPTLKRNWTRTWTCSLKVDLDLD